MKLEMNTARATWGLDTRWGVWRESARHSVSISFADTLSGLTIERSGPRGWTWNWPVIGRPTLTRRLNSLPSASA